MVRMKAERLRRGWNQTKLAYHSGVAITDISKFETRRALPYPRPLQKLARTLRLDPSTLLDEVNESSGADPPAA